MVQQLLPKPIVHTCTIATPFLEECEDDTHTLEMGTWESFRTFKISELDFKGQNTSSWGVLHVIENLLKCTYRKWPRMSHLDICSTSYGKKKGRESNWQFDSRPLKVGNRPDPGVCRWSATHRWKALKERYKFVWDLIPIGGLSKELWTHKVPRVQTGIVSGLLPGSPETKTHSGVGAAKYAENTIWGRWWLPPSLGHGESYESRVARGLS